MAHDVFISYASQNREVADLVCRVIESTKTRCWIAPRDIMAGVPYPEAILNAIDSARVFVVIFSAAANESPQVPREVNRAVSKKIPVVPFRIEKQEPTGSMDYLIGVTHWLDAFQGPLESHWEKLIQSIVAQLDRSVRPLDLATALATMDAAITELGADTSPLSLERVARVIELAISFGATIYNAGSHDGCAAIYLKTARGLVARFDNRAPPAANANTLAVPAANDANTLAPRLTAVRDDLRQAAAGHETVPRENAKSLAWELRFAFDRTLRAEIVERGIAHVDQVLAELTRRNEPLGFRDLCETLQTAIAYGNVLYKDQDFSGIIALNLHAIRRILAAIPNRGAENGDRHRLDAARGELVTFLSADGEVRGKDAERLAWDVYETMLRVLKLRDA